MELFKYLSEDRTDFFAGGRIRFTQPQAFNDPFELKPSFSLIGTKVHIEEAANREFSEIIGKLYRKLPFEYSRFISQEQFALYAESKRRIVLEYAKNLAELGTPMLEKIVHDGFENNVGVLSLTESPDNLLMWAHYANSHKGFVVEFDSEHPFFDQRKSEKDELRHLKKINYTKTRPSNVLMEVENMSEFLVKSTDWAYEKEWRILAALDDADKRIEERPYDVFLFRVPFNAIKSVRVGARASSETRERIRSLLSQNSELNHVAYLEMTINNKRFELHAKKMVLSH